MQEKTKLSKKAMFAWVLAIVLVLMSATIYFRQNPISIEIKKTDSVSQQNSEKKETKEIAKSVDNQPQEQPVAPQPEKSSSEQARTHDKNDQSAYIYTAKPGDSYTAMVRNALGQYEAIHQISEDTYDTLAAEVALINKAGSPFLEIGQNVSIPESDIKSTIDQTRYIATSTQAPATATPKTKDSTTDTAYTHTAQAGDSYATVAREAIEKYSEQQKLSLTPAQRIAAESVLLDEAGHPSIEIDQAVAIDSEVLRQVVKDASGITESEQAAWLPFAYAANLQ